MSDSSDTKSTKEPIQIRLPFRGVDEFLAAYTQDPSLGGVFVATKAQVPIGTPVSLLIELSEGRGMQVLAEVAFHREASPTQAAGVGLRFTELQDKHREWLKLALKKKLSSQPMDLNVDVQHQLRRPANTKTLAEAQLDIEAIETPEEGEVILGIDLGTSNSCASIFKDGEAVVLDLGERVTDNPRTIPSVVGYDDHGNTIVGGRAWMDLPHNPKRTIYGSKRFIGRVYDHPEVQKMLSRYSYKVVPGPQQRVAVEINNRPINLTAVAAKILEHINIKAQETLKRPIHRAVITVPAFYNQNQRHAVMQAARLAGLQVERILNEPTAAAIAYGLTRQQPRRILVYDLGGGTFDVSVMDIGDNKLNVLATAGDTFLGGEDIDNSIVNYVCERHKEKTGQHLSRNHSALALVKIAAEQAKRRLSNYDKAMVTVREAMLIDGGLTRVEIEMSREEIETLVEPMVTRTLKICDMTLRESNCQAQQLHDIVLVGGQTRMPYVQNQVREHFGREPLQSISPDEVVALGAGLVSQLKSTQSTLVFRDVLPMSIGIDMGGGLFEKILEKNTSLPVTRTHRIKVGSNDLAHYKLPVFQGEETEIIRNELLGTLRLAALEPGPDEPNIIDVEFLLSADCMLKVRATHSETKQSTELVFETL